MSRQPSPFAPQFTIAASRAMSSRAQASSAGLKAKVKKQSLI
jgi:hypothetical protein